jgi:hypothetical protein
MQNISEIRNLIDEMEAKIDSYGDKTVWQKSNSGDWYTFVTEHGPKIIASWREIAGLISLCSGEQLLELMAKWENIQLLVQNQEVLQLAMKFKRNVAPPNSE